MHHSTSSPNLGEKPSTIVCIAYGQLSMMTGIRDLTEPRKIKENEAPNDDGVYMVCTRRLFRLPIFVSVTSTFCDAYTTLKNSHESVTSVLNSAENRLNEGIEYVSPFTRNIAATLETPLKGIDNAICIGMDFLERHVPSIKLPPSQIYVNFKDSFRSVIESFNIQYWTDGIIQKENASKLLLTYKSENDSNSKEKS